MQLDGAFIWSHFIVLLLALFLGAWLVRRYPGLDVIGRITGR